MQDKSYAIVALREILIRALAASASALEPDGAPLAGWDLEFAQMSRDEQAGWLIRLFMVLVEHG